MFGAVSARFARVGIEPPTFIGMSAVLIWSATIGLYRNIAEIFGPVGGSALIFTVSGLAAAIHGGRAAFRGHSPRYLLIGGVMFVTYEIALALGVGFATSREQSIEVGMINYLWPCLTIAFAVLAGQARADYRLIPGVLLCLYGVYHASAGAGSAGFMTMLANTAANPLPYVLAFIAALFWPLYTIVTRSLAGGRSAVAPLLLVTAAVLWGVYATTDEPPMQFNLKGAGMVLAFGVLTTLAYSAWTVGIARGNLTQLATASYFTPLLSILLSSLLLDMMPAMNFWAGALLVTAGSLVCWLASRG